MNLQELIDLLMTGGNGGEPYRDHPAYLEVVNTHKLDRVELHSNPVVHYMMRQVMIAQKKFPEATGLVLTGKFSYPEEQCTKEIVADVDETYGVSMLVISEGAVTERDGVLITIRWGLFQAGSPGLMADNLDALEYRKHYPYTLSDEA